MGDAMLAELLAERISVFFLMIFPCFADIQLFSFCLLKFSIKMPYRIVEMASSTFIIKQQQQHQALFCHHRRGQDRTKLKSEEKL
jgi:hypothetical protein